MLPIHRSYLVLTAVLGVTAAGLGWQHRITAKLDEKIDRQRAEARELSRLRTENQRLAAVRPTAEELADLLARQVTLEQLRKQRAAMQGREQEMAQAVATEPAAPSLKGNSVAFKLWRNVGQATPDAAFETALWAAAAGDLDTLAGLLTFDDEVKKQATTTFDHLPAAMQNELGSPEKLVALLTAIDVPLGRASILGQVSTPTGTRVTSQLIDAEGKSRTAVFTLQAEDDRWRLKVSAGVVAKYDHWLRAAANSSTVLK